MGAIVKHKVFGTGIVKRISEGFIEVDFSGTVKKFQFPKAFEGFLSTDDEKLLETISMQASNEKIIPTKNISKNSETKKVIPYVKHSINNSLVGERAQTISVSSETEMFELVGYMAKPGRVNSIEAEVPKDGRDKTFEKMFPGQTYRPIEMGNTPSGLPNKLSPQFRINFSDITNCPTVLLKNMGKGNGSCVARINKSKFVIDIVLNYGFTFGSHQNLNKIRDIAQSKGYIDAFERGIER